MTTELRSTTFTIKVNVDGKEKIVEVTRAVSDLDGAEKSIKATLGDVASVTTSVTKSQKELNQQARVAVTEAERQHKQTKRVVDEYKNLNKALTMSAEDAQVFNAQMRAGVDPMSAQGKQIEQLVLEHQRLAKAQGHQQGSLRDSRGIMQNFGWQMQDTIVQLQMGTSAFTVLSQQGSQMAAAFGPKGAVLGAIIALAGVVGGALFTSLAMSTKKTSELVEEINKLASSTDGLGKAQAELAKYNINKQTEELGKRYTNLKSEIASVEWRFDGLKARYKEMGKELSKGQEDYFTDQLRTMRAELETTEKALTKAGVAMGAVVGGQTLDDVREYEKLIVSLDKAHSTLGMTSLEAARYAQDNAIAAMNLTDAQKKVIAVKLQHNRIDEDRINLEKEAKEAAEASALAAKKAANDRINDIKKAAELEAKYALSKMQFGTKEDVEAEKSRQISALNAMDVNYASQKVAIEIWADKEIEKVNANQIKRETDLARERLDITRRLYGDTKEFAILSRVQQYEEDRALAEKHGLSLVDVNANYYKDMQEIQERFDDSRKSGLDAWLESTEKALSNHDKLVEQSLDRFTSGFGDAFANSIMGAESVGDAFKGMFEGMASSMLKYFGEWAAQEMMMWALKRTIGAADATAKLGAVTAFATEEISRAALSAFASTAAIPIVGPAMAPAAAGLATAAAAPFAATMIGAASAQIGAYDKGGVIPTKGYGIVSEFGDELVGGTLVYNNTPNGLNVTGREDTAKLLSGNRSTTNNVTINSSGNASPEAIGRAVDRVLRRKSKKTDTAVYDSMNRGRKNRGARFNA